MKKIINCFLATGKVVVALIFLILFGTVYFFLTMFSSVNCPHCKTGAFINDECQCTECGWSPNPQWD